MPLISLAEPIHTPAKRPVPFNVDAWVRLQDRRFLKKPVDERPVSEYDAEVPHTVFQTVWRTSNERVPTMKVAVTDEKITYAREGKTPRVNEFMAQIAGFNDGKTRRIVLEEGDVLSTVLNDLRKAAGTIGRGVKVALEGGDPTAKPAVPATAFRFELRDKIVRTAKSATAPVAVPAPVAKKGNKVA